ncbi:MAG TPA: hypothetical protein PKL29_03895 [Methanothrix sp.]|nr:hypothetical protein [Methanothrix sp.]HPT37522.1 hypothetical protein [Methanothrix sp.]
MKALVFALICIFAVAAFISSSFGYQDVGGNYGSSWLENYGTMPVSTLETANDLWSWGKAPKGYTLMNGTAYPPGTAPQWYYPYSYADSAPIIINKSDSRYEQSSSNYADPWLLAQLSGRPVKTIYDPHSVLF